MPLIEAFLELLMLAQSRFAAEEILAWLEQPAIARRAGIESEDLPLLRDWLREAGVRWGRDGEQRARLGLPAESAFTWRQGLDRLLLGFAAPPQLAGDNAPLLGEHWPLDALEGARGQLLGRLVEFVERLGSLADQLARPRPLSEWADDLQILIDTLFDEREAGDTLLLLSQACAALRDQAQAADLTRPIELELVHQQLSAVLQQGGGASGFLTGAVTFCTMVPMRSLPFRVVCLLGLDDGAFPRRTPPSGFDLIGRHPRRGDRARRLDDRYLLLETLLSAREALYLSYVGRDPRDNAVLPPSVLLSEVLEAVDMTAVCRSELARDLASPDTSQPKAPKASEKILIAHPLQPFSPLNFGAACAGFSLPWFRAAQRLAEPPQTQPQQFASLLAEPDEAWLTIEPSQLLQCFRHPARFLLEQRLGLRLADDQESLASDEPFDLEMPAWNGLRRLSLQAMEHGWSDEDERRMACAAGWLPTGELGQALWGKLRGPVRAFAPRLFELRPDAVPEPLPVDITLAGVRVHGWLDGVTPAGLFGWKLGRLGEWDMPPFWLRHLLLNLSAPPVIERQSLMLSPAGDWQLGPLANAAQLLEPWLAAYRCAIREPLPLLPRSSHAFAKGYRKPARGSEPIDSARKRAREAWLGAEFSPIAAEVEDPWNALAFRDRDPLDQRFETLAQELIGPALDALAQDEEEA